MGRCLPVSGGLLWPPCAPHGKCACILARDQLLRPRGAPYMRLLQGRRNKHPALPGLSSCSALHAGAILAWCHWLGCISDPSNRSGWETAHPPAQPPTHPQKPLSQHPRTCRLQDGWQPQPGCTDCVRHHHCECMVEWFVTGNSGSAPAGAAGLECFLWEGPATCLQWY